MWPLLGRGPRAPGRGWMRTPPTPAAAARPSSTLTGARARWGLMAGSTTSRQFDPHAEAYLSVPEAAVYLSVPERLIRRIVAERRVAFHKVGRYVRFRRADLDAFVQRVDTPY